MIVLYCKYAGMPYKSEHHISNLRHCGYVAIYWTMAFILKLITAFIPAISLDNIGGKTKQGDSESI
jgi:hypothetical protein